MAQLKLVGDGEQGELLEETVSKDPVSEIFDFWRVLMEKPHAQLGDKRRLKIRNALRIGYSIDDLRLAIVGCKYDDWSQGGNDRNRAFNDIELICRDETKIDYFIDYGNAYMKKTEQRDAKLVKDKADDAERKVMPPAVRARLDALLSRYKEKKT